MAKLIVFKPKREVDAETNLRDFVALCRGRLTVFGAALDFDANAWDVSVDIHLKGKKGRVSFIFSTWQSRRSRTAWVPMAEPFLSFGKSYVRYQHALRRTKCIGGRVTALRALCAALEEAGATSPTVLDGGMFNRAAQLLMEELSPTTAYTGGTQLELLAKFLDDHGLCAVPLQWRNPIDRPLDGRMRVGAEFDKLRQEKLPSAYVLDALARAFRAASEPFEVVVTSVSALLCSAPDRVNEVLRLPAECEVRLERRDKAAAYGLRFWASKGAEPMVKWMIPSMAGVVAEALERLRKLTKAARNVAAWYEQHPQAMYLPPHLEALRGRTDLSMQELEQVLFVEPSNDAEAWCKRNDVPLCNRGTNCTVDFADVEKRVIGMLPRGFPIFDPSTGLKFSEALCVVRRNEMHATRGVYWGALDVVDHGVVSRGLGGRAKSLDHKSVFDRLGLWGPDGERLVIRTSQFRHFLNTLAQSGGLSELDIAKWSGRANIQQNAAYNHVPDRDVQAEIAAVRGGGEESFDVRVSRIRQNMVPRASFAALGLKAAHTTDYGFCAHDFAMSPCQLHMDCMNCNEQECLKGDVVGERNARTLLSETNVLLREAEAAMAKRAYGASQWVQHQEVTRRRLSELVAILDDPKVPVGAVIRLSYIKPPSRFQQAVETRAPHLLAHSERVRERLSEPSSIKPPSKVQQTLLTRPSTGIEHSDDVYQRLTETSVDWRSFKWHVVDGPMPW